ncbi:MAG: hypothetical protein JW922_08815, partial [Paludibacteraceae bacterium]|nr:hypothetical protein [Paludibacteraceae bacterium]
NNKEFYLYCKNDKKKKPVFTFILTVESEKISFKGKRLRDNSELEGKISIDIKMKGFGKGFKLHTQPNIENGNNFFDIYFSNDLTKAYENAPFISMHEEGKGAAHPQAFVWELLDCKSLNNIKRVVVFDGKNTYKDKEVYNHAEYSSFYRTANILYMWCVDEINKSDKAYLYIEIDKEKIPSYHIKNPPNEIIEELKKVRIL